MNNRKENEQSCIVMNKKEGASCITTHLHQQNTRCNTTMFYTYQLFNIDSTRIESRTTTTCISPTFSCVPWRNPKSI